MSGDFRLRVCYEKTGRLRWLSHLEVLRATERLVRRADLPTVLTQGFNKHLKLAFGPALPVGTAGLREYFDVWLSRYTVGERVLEQLQSAACEGLKPNHASYVGERAASLTASLTIAEYTVDIEGKDVEGQGLREALERLIAAGELRTEHKGKTKVYDLSRSVPKDVRVESTASGAQVGLTIRMGPEGSLRPEVLVRSALHEADISIERARVTRCDLLCEDEHGVWSRPV